MCTSAARRSLPLGQSPKREVLEHAVHPRVPEQAAKADEAIEVGFGTPRFVHRVTEV
jgi:hypothetical protein